ncbi:MAG: YncE family protein, partial [Candidatus Glassbacteria bacterium]
MNENQVSPNGTVTVVDWDDQVIETIQVGNKPNDIATTPDVRWIYVTNGSSGTVSCILTDNNTVETIDLNEGSPLPPPSTPMGVAVEFSGL